jgi:hypothetical protein
MRIEDNKISLDEPFQYKSASFDEVRIQCSELIFLILQHNFVIVAIYMNEWCILRVFNSPSWWFLFMRCSREWFEGTV